MTHNDSVIAATYLDPIILTHRGSLLLSVESGWRVVVGVKCRARGSQCEKDKYMDNNNQDVFHGFNIAPRLKGYVRCHKDNCPLRLCDPAAQTQNILKNIS